MSTHYRSIFTPNCFAEKHVIVTGGGSGIGRCTAHELSALGANVILLGRNAERLQAVVDEIDEVGGRASWHSLDIRDEDAVKTTVKAIVQEHEQIHGLVNNAGGQFPAPLATISKKGFDAVVGTNLVGGFLVAREVFAQSMRHKHHPGGSIVNIVADMWGGMPGMGHSGAARAGMVNFTETAAVEWASAGVRVNAVAPGFVASSGLDRYDPAFIKTMLPQMQQTVPMQRLATEAEISAAIVFLLSPAAGFISGECLKVDGAASCNTKAFPMPKTAKDTTFDGFHLSKPPAAMQDKPQ